MFELSPHIDKNKIFLVKLSDIEGRLDPHFYSPKFQKLISKFSDIKHSNLGALVSFSSETWNQVDFFDDEFPYIEISEIDITSGEIGNIKYVPKSKAPSRAKKIVRQNDIIISTTRPHRGAITLINERYDFHIASTGFSVIRNIKSENITLSYLYFILRQNFTLLQMEQRSSGGNYPAITEDELKKILIPLPPKETQQKIIDLYEKAYNEKQQKEAEAERLLNSIDDYLLGELGIELPEKDNSLEKRMFKVNFSEVTGNRWNSEYHQPYFKDCYNSMSRKYELIELSDLSLEIFQGVGRDLTDDNKFHLLKVKNIKKHNQIDYTDIENVKSVPTFKLLRKYDIISPFIGEAIRQIKFSNFYKEEGNWTVDNNTGVIRLKLDIVNPEFICQILNSRIGKIQIHQLIGGGGVPFLGAFNVRKFKIPLPPIEKQYEIAEHIKAIREQAKQLKAEAKEVLEQAKQEVEKMILGE